MVRKPRQGRRQAIEVVDPEIVELIRRWFIARGDHFSATLVSVLAYACLRPGEALGFQRRHVRTDTMLIEQAVAHGKRKLQKTGRVYRTMDLLAPLVGDFVEWFETADLDRPNAGLFLRLDGGWFHQRRLGQPARPPDARPAGLGRAAAGVPVATAGS